MKNHLKIFVSALAFAGLQAHGQVANGNFSAGQTDWTLTPAAAGSDTGLDAGISATPIPGGVGANYWGFGDVANPMSFPASYDELSQSIATSAGSTYDISFWIAANNQSYLRAYFGATEGFEMDNFATVNSANGAIVWTQVSFDAVATGPSTTLAFYGNNVPSFVGVADVSATDLGVVTHGVPDAGSTLGLLGAALVGLNGLRRKLA
jgi:hypothetical protein